MIKIKKKKKNGTYIVSTIDKLIHFILKMYLSVFISVPLVNIKYSFKKHHLIFHLLKMRT